VSHRNGDQLCGIETNATYSYAGRYSGMPDPISSVSHRDLSWSDQPSDRGDFRVTLEQRADERTYGIRFIEPCSERGGRIANSRA
jgi:hypothetical protein